jgi:hypothetical protein
MIEIRFDKTKDEVALLIWFLVDHSVYCYTNCTKQSIVERDNFIQKNTPWCLTSSTKI